MSGPRYDANWLSAAESLDFYDLSGTLATALDRMGIAVAFESHEHALFHPGRCARIAGNGGQAIGVIGELHPDVCDAFDLGSDTVAYFELRLDDMLAAGQDGAAEAARFQSLSRFPGGPPGTWRWWCRPTCPPLTYSVSLKRVRLVERAELFDVYQGENVPEERARWLFASGSAPPTAR